MKQPKVGSIVEVIFDDHADGCDILRFRVYGVLIKTTPAQYTLGSWVYADNHHSIDSNVEARSIVRKAAISIRELQYADSNPDV